jgi:DNA-binding MarR family transcriptional regulator
MKQENPPAGAELRAFRRSLRSLEREVALALARETSCCGVTTAQCHFLLESEARPNASLSELAEALSLDSSTLSRTADALLGDGAILRDPDPENRRRVAIRLTERGREKVASINALCDASYLAVLESIAPEKRPAVVESVALLADALARRRKAEGGACCSPAGRKGADS